jgi:type I restriction enzyme M protein
VKTNVLFFTRASEQAPADDATREVWIYDARSGAPSYGKTNPFKAADLDDFVAAFGDDPGGQAPRTDRGEDGRFRRFTRADIAARGDNLDISWLRDTSADAEDGLTTPEEIAAAIEGHLRSALEDIATLVADMEAQAPALDTDIAEAAE